VASALNGETVCFARVAMINEREACESSCVSSGHCRAGGVHVRLPRAPGRHLDALIAPHAPEALGCLLHWHPARSIRSIRTREAVATTMWHRERLLSVADIAALIRLVSSCTATT
jgi:hypothetical protein